MCVLASSGFLCLAGAVDAWNRQVAGWSMETCPRTELALGAVNMALWQRRSGTLMHRSSQGTHCTSIGFGLRWKEAGMKSSGWAMRTTTRERIERSRFRNQAEAKMPVYDFIEGSTTPDKDTRRSMLRRRPAPSEAARWPREVDFCSTASRWRYLTPCS